ncbi:MAG: hypothetical protein ACYC3S_01850 [Chloroflexota bacterium]
MGTGGISGQIQRLDGTPLKGIIVYAAPVDSRGGERLASVDPLVDAHAATDSEGRLGINDLKAGEYALATQSPLGVILPHDNAGQVVTFMITADQETGLGLLQVGYVYPDGD